MGSELRDNLESQLAEVELLAAMFPGPRELDLDPATLAAARAWLERDGATPPVPLLLEQGATPPAPPLLELSLRLEVDPDRKLAIEAVIIMSPEYPSIGPPEIYIR